MHSVDVAQGRMLGAPSENRSDYSVVIDRAIRTCNHNTTSKWPVQVFEMIY